MRTCSVLGAITALILGVTACSAGPGRADNRIEQAALAAPVSFDPADGTVGPPYNYLLAAYESLINRAPDGTFRPGIATAWSYRSTTEFVMTIRRDVTFSDGSTLDAELVADNIRRYASTPGPSRSNLARVAEVTASAPTEVLLRLSSPDPSLPLTFSLMSGMMVSRAAIANPHLMNRDTAGSGPYVLDRGHTIDGGTYTYVRNPHYSGPMRPPYDSVVFSVIPNVTSQLNAILSGQVAVTSAQAEQRKIASERGLREMGIKTNIGGIWLLDRTGELVPALRDVRVRQALNHAIDRPTVTAAIWDEYATPTTQMFGEDTSAHDPALDERYPYDPELARRLLAEAGYPDGFTLPVLTQASFGFTKRLETVLPYFTAIGVRVEVVDRSTDYTAAYRTGDHPAAMAQSRSTDSFLTATSYLRPGGVDNPRDSEDQVLNELVDRAAAEMDPQAQAALFREVNARVVELAWFVPLAGYENGALYDPDVVTGVQMSVGHTVPLLDTWTPATP
jgi:peptide/nickel transport system substrate-binding protein